MSFSHKLMSNNFTQRDVLAIRNFLKKKEKIFTQSKNVLLFEKKWSKWLGIKYSVFVNSGSSANFISMLILKSMFSKKKEIIVPTLTWVSDINSVIMSGFKPIFVDILAPPIIQVTGFLISVVIFLSALISVISCKPAYEGKNSVILLTDA